jgi:hypothetical protein
MSSNLKDIEVGVVPVTNTNKIGDAFNKEYRMNFAGQPLELIEFFKLKHIHKKQKQTYKYDLFGELEQAGGVCVQNTLRLPTSPILVLIPQSLLQMDVGCSIE